MRGKKKKKYECPSLLLGALGGSLGGLLSPSSLLWLGLCCLGPCCLLGFSSCLGCRLLGLGSGLGLGCCGLLGRRLLGSLGRGLSRWLLGGGGPGSLGLVAGCLLSGWFLGGRLLGCRLFHLVDLETAGRAGSLGLRENALGHQALQSQLDVSLEARLEAGVVGGDVLDDRLTTRARAFLEAGDGSGHHVVVGGMGSRLLRGLGLGCVGLGGGHLDLLSSESSSSCRESGAFLLRLTNAGRCPRRKIYRSRVGPPRIFLT